VPVNWLDSIAGACHVIYNANGGAFMDGETEKVVGSRVFDTITSEITKTETKYSHTQNIDDE
jgi:hypothetical protein